MRAAGLRTQAVVKLLLSTDSVVTADQMNLVLEILKGNPPVGVLAGTPLPHVVHRREAMRLLGVASRTIDNYVEKGLLTPVRGCGRKVVGYSEESVRCLAEGRAEVGKEADDER